MTKREAQMITDLKFTLEKLAYEAQDPEDRQVYENWLKTITPEYIKAQRFLARYE